MSQTTEGIEGIIDALRRRRISRLNCEIVLLATRSEAQSASVGKALMRPFAPENTEQTRHVA